MLFAPPTAALLEFEHTPHVDRVIGAIAVALGLDYWLVPQLAASFRGEYVVDNSSAAAVVRLAWHARERQQMRVVPGREL